MGLCDWGTYNASRCLNCFRNSLAHEAERSLTVEEISGFEAHIRTMMRDFKHVEDATATLSERLRALLTSLFMMWLNINAQPTDVIMRLVSEHETTNPGLSKRRSARGHIKA